MSKETAQEPGPASRAELDEALREAVKEIRRLRELERPAEPPEPQKEES